MNTAFLKNFFKSKHNIYLAVIFIIGIVLMMYSAHGAPTERGQSQEVRSEEERLEKIISDIKGAGRVSVMITYTSGAGKELAYETKTNRSEKSGGTTENIDTQAVITSGSPVILREMTPEVRGVIVTAEGAGNARVRADISNAVCAALGVMPHKVCIFEKK